MDADELLKKLAAEENLNQITTSEAKPNEVRAEETNIPDALLYGIATSFVITCTVFFLMLSKRSTERQEKEVSLVKHFSQIPCKNCQFLSKSLYLKCAVQPSIVLTAKAIDCSDYLPR